MPTYQERLEATAKALQPTVFPISLWTTKHGKPMLKSHMFLKRGREAAVKKLMPTAVIMVEMKEKAVREALQTWANHGCDIEAYCIEQGLKPPLELPTT